MRTWALAIAVTTLSWSIAGCTAQAREPEPVPVDRVECARCRMLISSESGSAQIVSGREDTRFYDDVGCLAADWHAHGAQGTAFVRLSDGRWSDARAAFYARPTNALTPMGSGVVAYEAPADAAETDRDRRAHAWLDIVALVEGGK